MVCLGGEIEVPTISGGKAKMKIPPGTENGQIFRLKGNGIPYLGLIRPGRPAGEDQHQGAQEAYPAAEGASERVLHP